MFKQGFKREQLQWTNPEFSLSSQESSLFSTLISFPSLQPPATSVCCSLMLPRCHKELTGRDAANICCACNPKRTGQVLKDRSCYSRSSWTDARCSWGGIVLPSQAWFLGGRSGHWGQKRLADSYSFRHRGSSMASPQSSCSAHTSAIQCRQVTLRANRKPGAVMEQ